MKMKDVEKSESKQGSLASRALFNFLLWILLSASLGGIFFAIDYLVYFDWAQEATILVSIIGFNIATADILRYYVERHGRNTVSWTTAIVLFSPFFAGILYLLTWPRKHEESDRRVSIPPLRISPVHVILIILMILWLAIGGTLAVTSTSRYTASQVARELTSQYWQLASSRCTITPEYEGWGRWLVTIEGVNGETLEAIFHEGTRKFVSARIIEKGN